MFSRKIQELLEKRGFRELTEIQKKAIPLILQGKNCLVVAPTGWGKTEAALLPLLDRITHEQNSEKGILVLYITPLRALNRDILERMFWWCDNLGVGVSVRHGDTSQAERSQQLKKPPKLLITTPESLQALLCAPKMRENLRTVKAVVVDEIHELYSDKRGVQLSVALERLEELVHERNTPCTSKATETGSHSNDVKQKKPDSSDDVRASLKGEPKVGSDSFFVSARGSFQRIGLSATVGDEASVAGFLVGVGRECVVARVDVARRMELSVFSPPASDFDEELAKNMHVDLSAAARLKLLRGLIEKQRTIVFTNTRAVAEILCSRLLALKASVGVHHGSLSKEVRVSVEEKFKAGKINGLISTSSLELGIDVGDVEKVVQFMSPRMVQRLVQRVGRSGHAVGRTPRGEIIASDVDDLLESAAVVKLAHEGRLEKEKIVEHAFSVVAHQIVGLLVERGRVGAREAFELIARAKPFERLSFDVFLRICEQLRVEGLLKVEGADLIKSAVSRDYYYSHLSTIPSERKFRVLNAASNSVVSSLDEAFVMSLEKGELFITKGVPWKVLDIDEEEVVVEPAQTFDAAVPDWEGEEIPVPLEVAREVGKSRRKIVEGKPEETSKQFFVEEKALKRAKELLERQEVVPSEKVVFVECLDEVVVIHVCGGMLANAAIAKALAFLLTSRFGSSVRAESDAYRILLRLPQLMNAETVKRLLFEIVDVQRVLEREIRNTSIYRYKFLHAARSFGLVGGQSRMGKRLIEKLSGTIIGEEALQDVFRDYVNVGEANALLKEMRDGKIDVIARNVGELSPLARIALNRVHASELIAPVEPNSEILKAFRKEIEGKTARFACTYCGSIFYSKIDKLGKKIECEKCGAKLVALAEREQDSIIKGKGAKGKRKEYLEFMRSASLIEAYGKRAVAALNVYGVGVETAARVLARLHRDENVFYAELLEAQKNFIRTKRYWAA